MNNVNDDDDKKIPRPSETGAASANKNNGKSGPEIERAAEMMQDLGLMPNQQKGTTALITSGKPLLRRAFTPRDLTPPQLARVGHVEWLKQFCATLSMSTGIKLTPFREGTITRLHWAAQWIGVLERAVKMQETQIARLVSKIRLLEPEDDGADKNLTKDELVMLVRSLRAKLTELQENKPDDAEAEGR